MLRKLLHDHPPATPPNVPQLGRLADKPLSPRERILAHQEEPQCLQCHRKIDPIGFGLDVMYADLLWHHSMCAKSHVANDWKTHWAVPNQGKPRTQRRGANAASGGIFYRRAIAQIRGV